MKLKQRVGIYIMALWKASGGKFKLDFRPWHGGRQGGNFEEFDFRSCHCGRQEWNYK